MFDRKIWVWTVGALVVAAFVWAGLGQAEEEEEESSTPSVIAIMFRNPNDAGWKKLEKDVVPALRKDFGEKAVLFVTADLATKADQHQSKMMCRMLGAQSVWQTHAKRPGHIVLFKYFDEEVSGVIDGKTTAKKAIAAVKGALNERVPIEEDEEEDQDQETDG